MSKVLYIDVETFGNKPEPKELILPTLADVKYGNNKDPQKRKEIEEEQLPKLIAEAKLKHQEDFDKEWRGNALKSLSLKVIAISFAIDDDQIINLYDESEEELFNKLNKEIIGKYSHEALTFKIVSHNGTSFDWPIIRHRCFKYGLSQLYHVFTASRYNERMYDTQEQWRGSDFKSYYSMDGIAKFLGLEGKKGITGDMVHDMYLAGKIKEISEYCGSDIEILRNIYNKLNFK